MAIDRRSPRIRRRALQETGPGVLPDSLQFMQLLWALAHRLQKRSKRMNAELGVTGPQRLVLRVVGLVPGTSAGMLATILHVHPSTLTGVVQRLTRQGLLRRSAHQSDRRRSALYLTTRGQRVNTNEQGTVEAAVAAALRQVTRRDAIATERVLTVITKCLDNG